MPDRSKIRDHAEWLALAATISGLTFQNIVGSKWASRIFGGVALAAGILLAAALLFRFTRWIWPRLRAAIPAGPPTSIRVRLLVRNNPDQVRDFPEEFGVTFRAEGGTVLDLAVRCPMCGARIHVGPAPPLGYHDPGGRGSILSCDRCDLLRYAELSPADLVSACRQYSYRALRESGWLKDDGNPL